MRFILASQSPRRRELLALFDLPFEMTITNTDETRLTHESPVDYARRLSLEKAQAAAHRINDDALILAADTIVIDGDEVLGKPETTAGARRTLERLRGREHQVCTAVTLFMTATDVHLTELACSPVSMRNYNDDELTAYIQSGDPFDKAGAYAIQHPVFDPVEGFFHCYANVMGLPLCHVARVFKHVNIKFPVNIATACQEFNQYTCTVYQEILRGLD